MKDIVKNIQEYICEVMIDHLKRRDTEYNALKRVFNSVLAKVHICVECGDVHSRNLYFSGEIRICVHCDKTVCSRKFCDNDWPSENCCNECQ